MKLSKRQNNQLTIKDINTKLASMRQMTIDDVPELLSKVINIVNDELTRIVIKEDRNQEDINMTAKLGKLLIDLQKESRSEAVLIYKEIRQDTSVYPTAYVNTQATKYTLPKAEIDNIIEQVKMEQRRPLTDDE